MVNIYRDFIRHHSRLDHEWAIKIVHNSTHNLFSVQTKVISNYSYKVFGRAISTNLAIVGDIDHISKSIKYYFWNMVPNSFVGYASMLETFGTYTPNFLLFGYGQIRWPLSCIISCPFIEDRSMPKGVVLMESKN